MCLCVAGCEEGGGGGGGGGMVGGLRRVFSVKTAGERR